MANILIIAGNAGMAVGGYGGAERSLKLAEAMPNHDVTALMHSNGGTDKSKRISPNLNLINMVEDPRVVPYISQHAKRRASGNLDIALYEFSDRIAKTKLVIKKHLANADLVILDHYGSISLVKGIDINVPIIYASHNCETDLAKQVYQDNKQNIQTVTKMETEILDLCDAITYCSREDMDKINALFNFNKPSFYIPNGTDERVDVETRNTNLSKDILFIGSGHPPNVEAAKNIIPVAKQLSEYRFHIVGKCSDALKDLQLPKNMILHGHVEDPVMDYMFLSFFAFINPMKSGSGTHLKVMRALSYGIPIISSDTGMRGFSNEEMQDSVLIANDTESMVDSILKLENKNLYKEIASNTLKMSKPYLWPTIQKDFAKIVDDMLGNPVQVEHEVVTVSDSPGKRKKVLIYSIIRNRENNMDAFYKQIKDIVNTFGDIEFYLSIYENDSTDGTKAKLFEKDWSFCSGVSIISENINTPYFGSVKDATRVQILSDARNKAIEAGGFINIVDQVLMLEGDISFTMKSIERLLTFEKFEPDFDVVSAVSLRPNGKHYDWWATRTSSIYVPGKSELDPMFRTKEYGPYYSTSNGLCLYNAKPFKEGVRHGWINKDTQNFDCEMVVLCQNFRNAGYNKIFIDYKSIAQH